MTQRPDSFIRSIFLAASLIATNTLAQLSVTEVHSNQTVGSNPLAHADWWELSNYGTTSVDLTGWIFNDTTGGTTNGAVIFSTLILGPGDSAIFVEGLEPSQFRSWWGSSLRETVPVFTYTAASIGLSSTGDGIRLWRRGSDSSASPIVTVDFGASGTNTQSFVPDSLTGLMTARSAIGEDGAWASNETGDGGSPGVKPAAIPLSVLSLTRGQAVNPGDSFELVIEAAGVPRPRYQWRQSGINIAGATESRLRLSSFEVSKVGVYTVALDNGLESRLSEPVELRLSEKPVAPLFTKALTNTTVFSGANLTWEVMATGVPQPLYAWFMDGVAVTEQSGGIFNLGVVKTDRGGVYTVVASNGSGAVTNSAVLTVLGRPDIRITEVSNARTVLDPGFIDRNGFGPEDWWELTSFAPVPVLLTGWRFDDNSASLPAALVVAQTNLFIAPGESIIFVERLTSEQFRQWWGTNELPVGLKILTYTGSGIGLSSAGDGVRVWNASSTVNSDTIAAVDFPAGEPGVSFNYLPETEVFGSLSVLGVNGVYQAPGILAGVPELGSPGRIRSQTAVVPPVAPFLTVGLEGNTLNLRFAAEMSRTYRLQRQGIGTTAWETVDQPIKPLLNGTTLFLYRLPSDTSGALFRVIAE
ncbi:MAG: hypothetical protein EXS25_09180 [Pedosphaera sp.]|nr:hypothetical protein [Pedosphaera sp.]